VADFRDEHIKRALDVAVAPYQPDPTRKARLRRIGVTAALALAVLVAYFLVLHFSTPRPGPSHPPERKPIAVELLPAKR
jgi:hypothetical protein